MRIGLLTRRFDAAGGGTERDLIVTAECLRSAGHQITIFADEIRSDSGEGRSDWKIVRVSGPRMGRALSLLRFAYAAAPAARRAGNDLVISFARCVGADVMRSGGGAHVSYLRAAHKWRGRIGAYSMRLSPYHQVQMLIERQAFRHSGLRRTIAVSNLVRSDLIREFGLDPEKTVTIYNGVDLDRFRPAGRDQAERASIRQKFVIPASARVVIFVGNGFARKGLGFLIEAWPLVAGGAFLLVVGAYPPFGTYDECRTSGKEHDPARTTIPKVALPRKDPVYGRKRSADGVLAPALMSFPNDLGKRPADVAAF